MNSSPQRAQTPLLAWGILIALALIWGSSFIVTKTSLDTYTVTEVAAGRLFVASLFFMPIAWRTYKLIPKDRYLYIFLSALSGYIIPAFLFSLAGTRLNSSLSGMLNSLSPLFTMLIGFVFFKQKSRQSQVLGIIIGLVGALLLVFARETGTLNVADPYVFLVVLGTLLYGLNINIITQYIGHLPALAMAGFTFVFIGPIALGFLLTTDFFTKVVQPQNFTGTAYLVLLGFFASGVAAVLFNRLVQLSSGLFASSVTYMMPIVAVMWGLFAHETITVQQYLGMGVILGGIYLVNKK